MQRKKTFFDLKKQNFSKSKKSPFFSKRLTHAFGQKKPFFSLSRFDHKKRLEIMFFDFAEKKDTFLTFKNRIFQSLRNRIFSKGKGIIHAFRQKMPIILFI